MKFDFLRVICTHEHYVPLNLPFTMKGMECALVGEFKLLLIYTAHNYMAELDDDFCRQHFLVGLMLKEVLVSKHVVVKMAKDISAIWK